jgi:hypothetical protein
MAKTRKGSMDDGDEGFEMRYTSYEQGTITSEGERSRRRKKE